MNIRVQFKNVGLKVSLSVFLNMFTVPSLYLVVLQVINYRVQELVWFKRVEV